VIAPLKKRKKLVMFPKSAATGVALALIAGSKHLTYPEATPVQEINARVIVIATLKQRTYMTLVIFPRSVASGVVLDLIACPAHFTYLKMTPAQKINAKQVLTVVLKCSIKLMVPLNIVFS